MKTINEFWFDTKEEAEAFKRGIEYVNDGHVEVEPGVRKCKETDGYCIIVSEPKDGGQ